MDFPTYGKHFLCFWLQLMRFFNPWGLMLVLSCWIPIGPDLVSAMFTDPVFSQLPATAYARLQLM